MQIIRVSQLTGRRHVWDLDITPEQMNRIEHRYDTKELIQQIVPNLAVCEREFLINGTTPEEWTRMYGDPLGVNTPYFGRAKRMK